LVKEIILEPVAQPLTKAQKRKLKQGQKQNNSLRLQHITAKSETQKRFFQKFPHYDVISLHGSPGTGKTFLALYAALKEIENTDTYNCVKIIRSSVAVRDAGFLPGSIKDKMAVYEVPYIEICTELYGRGDAYSILKQKNQIEFHSTAHMRGITFRDCVVIIDECQNMSFQELQTLLTRFGENCKMILCGDVYQDDLTSLRYKEQSGFRDILNVLKHVPSSTNVEFSVDDIVRSGFVKEFILARMNHHNEKSEVLLLEDITKSVSLQS